MPLNNDEYHFYVIKFDGFGDAFYIVINNNVNCASFGIVGAGEDNSHKIVIIAKRTLNAQRSTLNYFATESHQKQ